MTEPQLRALEVLAKGVPVEISSETDYDQETVHWRPALALLHAGYARQAGEREIEITDDGRAAAKREAVA